MAFILADGQLAASAATILAARADDLLVNLHLRNTGGSSETVVLTVTPPGGTARSVFRAVLATEEALHITNLPLSGAAVLQGSTTNASVVDYLITQAPAGGAFAVHSLDANGAIKQVNTGVSGDQTIGGDLIVSGGDIDAGASGAAGTVDVFPGTASKGKLAITCTAQTGNTTVTLNANAMGQATTVNIPDPGAAASYVVQSTAALTLAEADVLDGVTAGTVTASKAVVVDANKDVSSFRDTVHRNIDAGASGTAGTVDVFPSTATSGKLAISCTDQTGDTTVSLVAGAMAAARTITLADPLADADVLTGRMTAVARTATADGTGTGTIADAGLLQFVAVTAGGDANSIIVLPTPTPGRIVILYVGATGYELRTSDPATISINGGAGAGAESAIGANTMVIAVCTSATTWQALSLSATTLAAVEAAA